MFSDKIPQYKGHLKQEIYAAEGFDNPDTRVLLEVNEWDNLVTTNGKTYFLQAATGAAARVLNNAQGGFLIGDGTTAPTVGDTNLVGTNKYRQAFDTGFPSTSGNVTTFQVTVAAANANFVHAEFGLTNASTTALTDGVLITRLLGGPYTKTSAAIIVYTYTLTQS